MTKSILTLVIALVSINLSYAQNINKELSKVTFEISNMGFKTVEGNFSGMEGKMIFNPKDLANSSFDVSISAASINTENEKRDEHLRTEDFFDVEKFPKISFRSKKINKTSEGYEVTGTLVLHGITKEVTIPFSYSENTLQGKLSLDRLDYELGPDGGFMVGHEVELNIYCVLVNAT